MRFIELFAGIGGFRYGLEKVRIQRQQDSDRNIPNTNVSDKNGEASSRNGAESSFSCVWANEWDKYACQVYRKHYGDIHEGDIRTVDPATIPEHELLCAGFPCQSFSIAGKRGGFEDTRGTLFFEICRIAGAKRTPYLLLENVKGLLSHDEGRTFQTIIRTLDELGYDCQWEVLNSKNFGVPQNRERVFIIGHLRGQPRPQVFPLGEELQEATPEGYERSVSGTISVKNQSGQAQWDGSTTLILNRKPNDTYGIGKIPNAIGQGTGRFRNAQSPVVCQPIGIRRLTPTECERLQGFPDGWTEGISDTQRYKCLGNAVTTKVIEAIGKRLDDELPA